MRLPNFFIVGAPKCGTTALYEYLRAHPDIYMPDVKEPHYFGSDLAFRYRRRPNDERYRSYFAAAGGRPLVGEASVWYLYSTRAAAEIRSAVPKARIIAMVRDPVDMIQSMHSQMVFNGHEDLSLRDALDAEEDRAAGRRIPRSANLPAGLLYRRVASYAEQIERYRDAFGAAAVHVIVFDDFRDDIERAYAGVLAFLGADPGFRPSFPRINANKRSRNVALRRLLNDPPEWARRPVRVLVPKSIRHGLYRGLVRANSRQRSREPIEPQLERTLRREMAPSVERLAALLGRDLDGWLPPRAVA